MGRVACRGRGRGSLRGRAFLGILVAAALTAGCGDPVVVLGDRPGIMRIVAGVPGTPGSEVGATALESLIRLPRGMTAAADGTLYLSDGNGRVLAVLPTGELEVLTERTGCAGTCVSLPNGLELDGSGRLLVADPDAHRVWRLDPAGGELTVVAGTGEGESSPDGTAAAEASVAAPTDVVLGADGRIYFAETEANRVRVVNADGTLGTVAGTGEAGFSGDEGPADEALLAEPRGLALREGTLFISDTDNQRVRAVDLSSGIIGTVAGTGLRGFFGDLGSASEAALAVPLGLAVSADGNTLYIADSGNHRIRSVQLGTGIISTFAGTGETEFVGSLLDAAATAIHSPTGVTVSALDLLYIADGGNHVVWRVPLRFEP